MLSSRFFWKLYLAFAVLVLFTLAGTGFLVHRQLQASLQEDVEARLLDMAASMVPYAVDVFENRTNETMG